MKSNENRKEAVRKSFDEIIKMSLEMDLNKEDDTPILTDDEMKEMGYSLPPDDMYDRIINACGGDNTVDKTTKKTAGRNIKWKKVLLIAAIITVFATVTLNASAVKVYILKTLSQITGDSIRSYGVNEVDYEGKEMSEEDAYLTAENEIGIRMQKPGYLPEGMVIDSVKIIENSRVKIDYVSDKGENIEVNISKVEDEFLGHLIDTTGGEIETKYIDDKEILFSYYMRNDLEKWTDATWNDENAMYIIRSDIKIEEFEKFIAEFK